MIQALVIFFVAADVLVIYIWRLRRYLRPQAPLQQEPVQP
jgi:hypothetical protein